MCLEIHEIFSSRLHRPIRPVIVGPFSKSFTYFTVINCRFSSFLCTYFFIFLFRRTCRVQMRPTPSCPSSFREGGEIVGNASISSPRLSMPFATHHRRFGFSSTIVGRIYLVLSTCDLFFILVWDRNIVWDCRAIDGKRLAREID